MIIFLKNFISNKFTKELKTVYHYEHASLQLKINRMQNFLMKSDSKELELKQNNPKNMTFVCYFSKNTNLLYP